MATLCNTKYTHIWYKNGKKVWASTKKEAEELIGHEIDNTWYHHTRDFGFTNLPITHYFHGYTEGVNGKTFNLQVNADSDKEAVDFVKENFSFVTFTYSVRVSDGKSIG